MPINTFKHMNHTKDEIEEYLKIVKKSINNGQFVICTTPKNEKVSFHKPEKNIRKLFI